MRKPPDRVTEVNSSKIDKSRGKNEKRTGKRVKKKFRLKYTRSESQLKQGQKRKRMVKKTKTGTVKQNMMNEEKTYNIKQEMTKPKPKP